MLENIREKSQGMTAKVILGLIILTFAFAGIGSYTNSVDTSVAEVNGEKISQQDFEQAFQQQRNRMSQQYGEMFESLLADPTYLNNLRNDVLNSLINEKLLDQNTQDLAIRISDERIKKTIVEMKEFHVDGVFDNNRYLALINQAGFRESSNFRDYLRVEMARQQLTQSLVATEFSLPFETEMVTKLRDQKRDLRFAVIAAEQFKAQVEVTDEEIKSHYQANQAAYQHAEKAKVNYVVLDVNDIAKTIETTDEDAEAFYKNNIASYTQAEKRRISHILIEPADDAETKINDLLAQIKAGGDFAELAKANSADTFSAENGGDLEWLEAGVMVPEFEEAAMALSNVGDVSDVVETEFGFHIIKLTEFEAEVITPFEEAKAEIMAAAATDAAQNKFFELKDELGRVSFEVPDSLDEAAEVVSAKVMTSDWLTRNQNPAPFNNSDVINAVFSDMVISENLNSEVIEVSDELAIVVHINEYQPAETKALELVSAEIKAKLLTQKANEKAQVAADELLAKFTAGEDITAGLTELDSQFEVKADVARFGSDVDGTIVRKAFTLPHPAEGTVSAANISLSNGDIALVEIQAVKPGNAETVAPQLAEQFAAQLSRSAYVSYIGALSEQAKITRRTLTDVANPAY
ncbi:SurA N-terminal domain-containing protein [Thalassotalea agariperforans]